MKRELTPAELDGVLRRAGLDREVAEVTRLAEGTYNTAYRVRTGGRGYVLKAAPGTPGLTYEHRLLETEARYYRAAAGLPVPGVVHTEPGLLLMTELPGRPWYPATPPEHLRPALRRQLGEVLAAQHRVTGPGFGYPQLGLAPTWPEAFTGMLTALLADARRYAVALPVPADRLLGAVASSAFAEVRVPALVHFDLWDGNILVHGERLGGLVDGERAFWGDPVAEFVSLALFGDIDADPDFLDGYGLPALTPAQRYRLACYQAYLYLVMLVETVPRGDEDPKRREELAGHLRRAADRF
ncbi:aminoglycoside phosphotransferase (APT) family kinase protein [Crossiella equi]|uniref:Aminoglycoside phosphotransferase (APT) family kinase protein n=1 Tax=Crossiella equi TaxID=130796 RepID=A0ABS5APB1_9PSEU|nr:aminoglycoside phosphotransferase family protein [Crossiella equi]MBP2478044.1 aminoglycoside phosphotransferase (APT) family kinase protein [Crossiella equi]